MEYREDLKKLSWDALYQRLVNSEASLESYGADRKILVARIESLRSELRAAQDSLARLESPPVFEVGKCYRTRDGRIVEVCENVGDEIFPLYHKKPGTKREAYHGISADGKSCILWYGCDLLPGPVDPPPTWTPPASMESGVWKFCTAGMMHPNGKHGFMDELRAAIWRDWTDPPRDGLWQVKDGKATYLGEA